jgi:hypothetical protein
VVWMEIIVSMVSFPSEPITAKSSLRYLDIKQLCDINERRQTVGSDIARSESESRDFY